MNLKKLTVYVLLALASSTAHAGVEVGNGGVGVLCQKKLEFFDLFEGKVIPPQLTPVAITGDYEKAAIRMVEKFSDLFSDPSLTTLLQQMLSKINSSLVMLPKGIGLELTADVGQFIKPKNCEFVQIINYRNDGQVYVDSELWNSLDATNKAAALVHETIYWYLRLTSTQADQRTGQIIVNEVDSSRVRKIVAYLFSAQNLEKLGTESGGVSGNRIKCDNVKDKMATVLGSTEFVLVSEQGRIKARFIRISGKLMISRGEAVFDAEDGLQGLILDSLIDKGISFEFYGIPDLAKLKTNGELSVVLKDETRALEYRSNFQCYSYNY